MVLLLIVTTPLFFSAFFLVKKKIIQREMEEKLEIASLETITVSVSDFVWLKKGKEILVNGKMFDVKSHQVNGTKITFTGLYDDKEKELAATVKNAFNTKKDSNAPFGQTAIKLLLQPLFTQSFSFSFQLQYKKNTAVFPAYSEDIVSSTLPSLLQPPRA
jgi:hypothetical protein